MIQVQQHSIYHLLRIMVQKVHVFFQLMYLNYTMNFLLHQMSDTYHLYMLQYFLQMDKIHFLNLQIYHNTNSFPLAENGFLSS